MWRLVVVFIITCLVGCEQIEPTATPLPPTAVPTAINTPTLVPTNTPTSTVTPTNTPIATSTSTPTLTPTNTPTATPLPTDTPTATPPPTDTPAPTATNTLIPTNTATSLPISTPPPPTNTALPVPTATSTLVPATPRPANTAAPTATQSGAVQTISYTEADILATVLQIAAAQGLPLSADNSTLMLQNGLVTIQSTQIFFGQQLVSNFVVRFLVINGQPVAVLDQADVNGEALPAEAVALIAQEITRGIAAELRADTNYTTVQSIVIANGLLTVTYQ